LNANLWSVSAALLSSYVDLAFFRRVGRTIL
jgi:hypothetical protein